MEIREVEIYNADGTRKLIREIVARIYQHVDELYTLKVGQQPNADYMAMVTHEPSLLFACLENDETCYVFRSMFTISGFYSSSRVLHPPMWMVFRLRRAADFITVALQDEGEDSE